MAGGHNPRSRRRIFAHACEFGWLRPHPNAGLTFRSKYNDLHLALHRLAVSAGVTITFKTLIRNVYFNEEKRQPVVVLEDGTTLSADVVIGADGYRSVVRKIVAPEADAGVETNHSFYTWVGLIRHGHKTI